MELVPFNQLTEKEYNDLWDENLELQTDMRQIKNIAVKVLKSLGIMDEQGDMNNMDMKVLVSIAMGFITDAKKMKEDMAFLSDALPLIEKYKDL